MPPDLLFQAANASAMAGWAVLVLAPRRLAWLDAVPRWVVPVGLSALYAGLMLAHFAEAGGGYGSIAEVRQLFASDAVLVAGWTHYLAFDLIVGGLMADRMDRAGISRLVQGPVLLTIFLFGPAGILLALATELGVRPLTRLRRA